MRGRAGQQLTCTQCAKAPNGTSSALATGVCVRVDRIAETDTILTHHLHGRGRRYLDLLEVLGPEAEAEGRAFGTIRAGSAGAKWMAVPASALG